MSIKEVIPTGARLIDTHAHLDGIEDIDSALSRAKEVGVTTIVAPGVDLASNKKNLAIKQKFLDMDIRLAFGIHPGTIKPDEIDATIDFIKKNKDEIVAVGEIGLDYWYRWVRKNDEKKDEQRKVFRLQLELAKEFDLPVIIHSRGAWKECLELVKDVGVNRGVFHWYSGPVDVLKEILDNGFFISATPALAYSQQLQEAIAFAPIEQTLIETDSPVFFQVDEKGFKAGPKDVFKTLEFYSCLKRIESQKAADILNSNAKKIFHLF